MLKVGRLYGLNNEYHFVHVKTGVIMDSIYFFLAEVFTVFGLVLREVHYMLQLQNYEKFQQVWINWEVRLLDDSEIL